MPGGNRTGPLGYGPMTGRRMGYCSGSQGPGYWHPGPGLGYGRGLGLGLGRGLGRGPGLGRAQGWRRYQIPFSPAPGYPHPGFPTPYAPSGAMELTPEEEMNYLKTEAKQIEDELAAIEKRIKEIAKDKK